MNDNTTPIASLSIANCFIVVDDHDKALDFYGGVLGMTVINDVKMDGFRWLSLSAPNQPDLQLTIQSVGLYPGCSDEDREAMATLLAKGLLGSLIFDVDDVDAVFEHVRASGAQVLQAPEDQFYGVRDCGFRDPAGNMVRFKTDKPA